jgi:hypothetical protein
MLLLKVKSAVNTSTFRFGRRVAPTTPLRDVTFVLENLVGRGR